MGVDLGERGVQRRDVAAVPVEEIDCVESMPGQRFDIVRHAGDEGAWTQRDAAGKREVVLGHSDTDGRAHQGVLLFSYRPGHHFGTDRVRPDEPVRPVLLGRADGDDDRGAPLKICFHLLPGAELELHGDYLAAAGNDETDLLAAVMGAGRLT